MGVVHHASYLRYLERTRIEWLRSNGHSYSELEAKGFFLPVVHASLDYRMSAYFDDELRVCLKTPKMERARMTLEYEILKGSARILIAQTQHVLTQKWTDPEGKFRFRPVRLNELFGQEA